MLVEKLLDSLKTIEFELRVIELEEQTFMEDYNGLPPRIVLRTYGITNDEWNQRLTEIMNSIGEEGKWRLYVTVDGIFVKKSKARYNQFGRWVGTDMKVYPFSKIVDMLIEKSEKAKISKLVEIIEEARKEFENIQK